MSALHRALGNRNRPAHTCATEGMVTKPVLSTRTTCDDERTASEWLGNGLCE